jgi:hypothetical protein
MSTRVQTGTGDNVVIGGFIIAGGSNGLSGQLKKVAIRGVGPSLAASGLTGVLADPILQLYAADGSLLAENDNWQDDLGQAGELVALGLGLQDPREAGIVIRLGSGPYTVIMKGKDLTSGIGLIEVYDVDHPAVRQLANTSTRGLVAGGDRVMIGGFILGQGEANSTVIVRGLGPSLSQFGLPDGLPDPSLELHDSNGNLLTANDNWQDHPSQSVQLIGYDLDPRDPRESGIFIPLPPGSYTAILSGQNGATGLGLLEIYTNLPGTTLTATSTADSGPGSLRDTINAAIDGDTIQFAPGLSGQVIDLTSTELVLDKNLVLNDPAGLVTIRRNDLALNFRIFHLMPGRTVTMEGLTISNGFELVGGGILIDQATLTLNHCTLTNNLAVKEGGGISNDGGINGNLTILNSYISGNGAYSSGPNSRGGGIYSHSGAVQIMNCRIDGNAISSRQGSTRGGGIYNDTGKLEIIDSLVADNYAFPMQPDPHFHGNGSGMGVFNAAGGTLTIRNTILSGNYSQGLPYLGYGGAVYNAGVAEINRSTIDGNYPSTTGGGIYNSGRIEIIDSTVRGNSTLSAGGGIQNEGILTLTNSTISDNTAVNLMAGIGGGIVNTELLIVSNSTLSNNHSDGDGGGIHNTGLVTISNTTISGNFAYSNGLSSGGSLRNLGSGVIHLGNTILNAESTDPVFRNSALVISLGYNLCSDDGAGLLGNPGDQINTDPMIGPLEDNGGPTLTHSLLSGSPAIDMGDPSFVPPPFSDQRGSGFRRVYGIGIDIGSFEAQPTPPAWK